MVRFFLERDRVADLVAHLMERRPVYAPHRKGRRSFAFAETSDPAAVVLDYPRTMQSVKKFFLPPREELLAFDLTDNSFDAGRGRAAGRHLPRCAFLRCGGGPPARPQLQHRPSGTELPDPPPGRALHRRVLRAGPVPLLRFGRHRARRHHRLRRLPEQAAGRLRAGGADRRGPRRCWRASSCRRTRATSRRPTPSSSTSTCPSPGWAGSWTGATTTRCGTRPRATASAAGPATWSAPPATAST